MMCQNCCSNKIDSYRFLHYCSGCSVLSALLLRSGAGNSAGNRLCCCYCRRCRRRFSCLHVIICPGFITITTGTTIAGSHRLDAAIVTGISRAVDEAAVLTPLGCSPIGIMLASCGVCKLPFIATHVSDVLHPPTSFVSTYRTRIIVCCRSRAGLCCHWRLCRLLCWLWCRLQCGIYGWKMMKENNEVIDKFTNLNESDCRGDRDQ